MEVILVAVASILAGIAQQVAQEHRRMQRWVFFEIWNEYMSRFENVELPDSWRIRWDRQMENNELPLTLVPQDPDAVEAEVVADITGLGDFLYIPTDGELEWLWFVRGNYEIADVLENMLVELENPDPSSDEQVQVMFVDPMEISMALAREGFDRAPMLSEDTMLQKIIWVIGPDPDYVEDEEEDVPDSPDWMDDSWGDYETGDFEMG